MYFEVALLQNKIYSNKEYAEKLERFERCRLELHDNRRAQARISAECYSASTSAEETAHLLGLPLAKACTVVLEMCKEVEAGKRIIFVPDLLHPKLSPSAWLKQVQPGPVEANELSKRAQDAFETCVGTTRVKIRINGIGTRDPGEEIEQLRMASDPDDGPNVFLEGKWRSFIKNCKDENDKMTVYSTNGKIGSDDEVWRDVVRFMEQNGTHQVTNAEWDMVSGTITAHVFLLGRKGG